MAVKERADIVSGRRESAKLGHSSRKIADRSVAVLTEREKDGALRRSEEIANVILGALRNREKDAADLRNKTLRWLKKYPPENADRIELIDGLVGLKGKERKERIEQLSQTSDEQVLSTLADLQRTIDAYLRYEIIERDKPEHEQESVTVEMGKLARIGEFLHAIEEERRAGKKPKKKGKIESLGMTDEERKELISIYDSLSPDDQAKAIALLRKTFDLAATPQPETNPQPPTLELPPVDLSGATYTLYRDRPVAKEGGLRRITAREHLEREWQPYIDAGVLYLDELRKRDPALVKALEQKASKDPSEPKASELIPDRSVRVTKKLEELAKIPEVREAMELAGTILSRKHRPSETAPSPL